jgi:hypothetical protein
MVEFEYKNGRRRTMRPAYANALEKLGQGKIVTKPAPKQTKVVKAEDADVEISAITGKPKRQYKRRDMTAQDE